MEELSLVPISLVDICLLEQTEYKNLSKSDRVALVRDSELGIHSGEYFRFYLLKDGTETVGVINMCGHGKNTVSVAPEIIERHRRKGYAVKALELAYSVAKKSGFSKVTAGIKEDNVASQKLHEKLGFELVERIINKNGNPMRIYNKYL